MSDDVSIRAVLAPMIEREVDFQGEPFRVNRAAVLARMASAGVQRRRWPAYVDVLAAAAAVLLAVASWRLQHAREGLEVSVPSGSAVQLQNATGEGRTLVGKVFIPSGGALETGAGSGAQVTTSDGLAIELQSDTRVSLAALRARESRLDLRRGAVRCRVAHRSSSHPFQVVAPDVTIVDLGTVFTVSIDETTGATSVSVEEGEVLVKHGSEETRVTAPGTWSSVEPPAASPPAPPLTSASPAPVEHGLPQAEKHERGSWPTPPPSTALSPTPLPPTTLSEESRLLRVGLAAERQGHTAEAISLFEQFLSRYPKSPLAPDARDALRRVRQSAP
jgi:ferric-dicitrate binding protein FerR (iron transport regulator)